VTIIRSGGGDLMAGHDRACFVDRVKHGPSDQWQNICGGGTWRYKMSARNVRRARKTER